MDLGTRYQTIGFVLRPPVLDGLLGGVEELLGQDMVLVTCHSRLSLQWIPPLVLPGD